jgi:dTDP-4-amino-4,6-dideoxygalactose transaminase
MQTPKRILSDLAIFGGPPAVLDRIYTGQPNLPTLKRFTDRVDSSLTRRWLSNNGPYVQELESRIGHFLRVKHCVATCNGTVALEIAIRALGLVGEVIVPSFSFVATAHALQWLGVTPIFSDVDGRTHNLDPSHVAQMITRRTSGIIAVHLWGRPCNIEELCKIADYHGIPIMFDAAHAFGCSYQGQMVGGFGKLEVFSFHATKFFHTFEGGAITTMDDALAKNLKAMRNFGFTGPEEVSTIGTNGKMNEICAAMGLACFEDLDEFVTTNYRNYECYRDAIEDLQGVRLVRFDESEHCNYQYIVLEIDEGEAGISRDDILQILKAENVIAKRYFYPGCHRARPYLSQFLKADVQLPQTDILAQRVLVLPTGSSVGAAEITGICELIRFVISNASEVKKKLVDQRHSGHSNESLLSGEPRP